ncbi:MAG: hypothetical protein CL948_01830, partial [Erythrobacter sp.]|nr:hypothetical protein [Erythrobacter sp.]
RRYRLRLPHLLPQQTVVPSAASFYSTRAGLECGVVLADTNDIKAGDQLEVFEVEERERTL